jgi:small GTP-binding protein
MSPDPSSLMYHHSSTTTSSTYNNFKQQRDQQQQQQQLEELFDYHQSPLSLELSPPISKSKIIVLGNSGVGKTSIIYSHKYGGTGFLAHSATIGASYINCNVVVENDPIQLQIWDTAGQERFKCMVPMYMRNATAAIIVYDITCRKSFEEVDKWVSELYRCSGIRDPIIFLIGNKLDLECSRQVTEGEGITKAARLNAHFFEVSAYKTVIIDSVFATLAEAVHDRMKEDAASTSASEPISPSSTSTSSRESPIFRLLTSPLNRSRSTSGDSSYPSSKDRGCCIQ